jgi:putative FmdB family regulatory protein
MPIYEYVCRSCRSEFELLLMPGKDRVQECPSCHSQDLEQTISAFSVNTQGKSQAAWNAARKKYKQTTFRDKKVAEREAAEHHLHEDH